MQELYQHTIIEAKIDIVPVSRLECKLECDTTFKANMIFQSVDPRLENGAIEPEWIYFSGIDEQAVGRFEGSKYKVFEVLAERANFATRFFWARENSGAKAFVALAKWIASHRTLFSDQCNGRRLAYDTKRRCILPPCVRSFDGLGGPCFTPDSVPLHDMHHHTRTFASSNSAVGSDAVNGESRK